MTAEASAKVAVDRPLPVPDAATGPVLGGRARRAACHPALRRLWPLPLLSAHACPHCSSPKLKWTQVQRRRHRFFFYRDSSRAQSRFCGGVPYVVAAVKLARRPTS